VSAAAAFRQHNSDAPVRILTDDPALPYARPPLSKEFLRGEAEASDAQLHPASWFDDRGIELVIADVQAIDTAQRWVIAAGTRYPYRSLVLASGSRPAPPPVPGGASALQLRSLADAVRLRNAAQQARSAVVIGAGFIGCEAAASLAMRGLSTTLVAPDRVPQLKRLGDKAGERIAEMLTDVGARYVGGVAVDAIEDGVVRLDNGVSIDCDLVLAATGVEPQSSVAKAAGIETAESRIPVDSFLRTSADGVYAAGDVALAHNDAAGRRIAIEHWQDADDQGAIAGANAAGQAQKWAAVPGFWTTIGEQTLKYHAWGDGYQRANFRQRDDGFTIWYEADGTVVGVLTHNADADYDRGEGLIEAGAALPDDVAR
jgi:3-phenylpropionate/trans-cinnamate dioxygenase ferredoxin reductase subunit